MQPDPRLRQALAGWQARHVDGVRQVPADPAFAQQVLDDVLRNELVDALFAARGGRWKKANTYAYDGARKSAEAVLLTLGLRVTSATGAHVRVGEAVDLLLAVVEAPDRLRGVVDRARAARHADEYPDPRDVARSAKELRAMATDAVRVVGHLRASCGIAPGVDDLLPVERNL